MGLPRLHLVTDDAVLRNDRFLHDAATVLHAAGADVAIHLRGHATSGSTLEHIGQHLSALALHSGAWLFVNDRIDVARAIRAHGVQLGSRSLPIADARPLLGRGAWIGYSAHSAEEAAAAALSGADFVVVGTIFATPTHADHTPAGIARITACRSAVDVPVVAIGGVTPQRVGELKEAGAYGVAVLGGVWHAADPTAAVIGYVAELRAQYDLAPLEEKHA
jgi:thiamine-phosphate pyrophosphorylase